uniref:divergent protein kinase domain 2A-like isoform X1 n=2 Tax=Myxine glutinosa TaxID=7769 RepID=UPI00358DFCD4
MADHPFRLRFFGADGEIGTLAGNREGPRKVVLKRLAAVSEMVTLDQDLCLRVTGKKTCNISFAVFHSEFNRLSEPPQPRLLMPEHVEGWSEPVHCPSQRLLDRIVRRFGEVRDSGSFLLRHLRPSERVSLLVTLAVNPEPLIFQSFPPDEGWPFAKYLGACGRIAVASYVGPELSNFRVSPWEKRVDLAIQALEMAEQLSTNEMDFSLYLLDVRPEAFSVGARDGRLIATQARHVLIVDRRHVTKTQPKLYSIPYETPHISCHTQSSSDCYHIPTAHSKLCSRLNSDHNYYAICRNLLAPPEAGGAGWGLLHSPPASISARFGTILASCLHPDRPGGRVQAARELKELLRSTVANTTFLRVNKLLT